MSDQQNAEQWTSVGACLKRLRNEKNLSIAEVAAKLYLQYHVVEALEEDDHENLPTEAYVYGYLQNYAKILDVPADQLVALYKKDTMEPREEQVVEKPEPLELGTRQPNRWLYAIMYLALFILVLVSFALWRGQSLEPADTSGGIDYPVPIVEHPDTPFYPLPDTGTPVTEPAPETAATPEPDTPAEPAAEPPATQTPATDTPVTDTPVTDTQTTTADGDAETDAPAYVEETISAGSGPDTVVLVLNTDCWIEIFDANNEKVYYDLARAGQTLVLSGAAPFSVLLGNADAATVEFNRMPFDITPHVTSIGIARFVLGGDQ